jgi:hypothetical protein
MEDRIYVFSYDGSSGRFYLSVGTHPVNPKRGDKPGKPGRAMGTEFVLGEGGDIPIVKSLLGRASVLISVKAV